MSEKLLKVEHLHQYFPAGGFGKNKKYVQAVERRRQDVFCCDCMSRPKDVSFIMIKYFLTAVMFR